MLQFQNALALGAHLASGHRRAPLFWNVDAAVLAMLRRYRAAVDAVSGKGSVTLKLFNL